ncbi:Macrolide export ATP-binding/permease protein MacB [Thermoflexales bacterium]|nr:Macrolide export ATP-binding/permease protein MacB [Thermoflexales bacterium]
MLRLATLTENIRMALRALRSNKLRAALTMLGIIIGVGAVITLVSVGRGVENYIGAAFGSIGTDLLFVIPGSPEDMTSGPPTQVLQGNVLLGPSLSLKDLEAVKDSRRVPDAIVVAPEVQTIAAVAVGSEVVQPPVSGVEPGYDIAREWQTVAGRFIDEGDVVARARVAVLGQTVVKELFPDQDPIGAIIKINRQPYKVIGVLEAKGGGMGGDQDNHVYVPLTTAHNELYPLRNKAGDPIVNLLYIMPREGVDQAEVIEQIKTTLRAQHNINYRDEDDFAVFSQADFLAAFGAIIGAVTIFLSAIAAVSLIVGGIGIMNIMLVTVTERTREIGLRKAIGAKRRDILAQFLIEAMTLSLLGGVLGILIGAGGAMAIGQLVENFYPVVAPGAVAMAVGFSVAVGLFFGLYPAWRASRLNPIEALRYE